MKYRLFVLPVLALALGSCGGENGGAPDGGGAVPNAGALRAKIGGVAFTAIVPSLVYDPASGTLAIFGSDQTRSIGIGGGSLNAPGTYAFQLVSPPLMNAAVSVGNQRWTTNGSGTSSGSGSITFTVLTTTRATGTFSFVAVPSTPTSATGNQAVTDGVFDILAAGAKP